MKTMLQGTTPTVVFGFSNSGLSVSDVSKAELTISSVNKQFTHTKGEMVVNTSNNTLAYTFTEEETLMLNDKYDAYYQLYVKIGGQIYGTKKTPCNIFQKVKGSVMD